MEYQVLILIAEQNKMVAENEIIPPEKQQQLQSSYPQWQEVTQTKEFTILATLLQTNPSPLNRKYLRASANLLATKEFKAYNNLTNSVKGAL
jgi:hypothetical protein